MDDESLDALISGLGVHWADCAETLCYAFYASLPAGDFDAVHLWKVALGQVPELISDNSGPYNFSPTNLWPADHTWFLWTDYDLQATKVSGDQALIDALVVDSDLECIDWHASSR